MASRTIEQIIMDIGQNYIDKMSFNREVLENGLIGTLRGIKLGNRVLLFPVCKCHEETRTEVSN